MKEKEVVKENKEEAVFGFILILQKLEAITESILLMNFRGDSRINEGEGGG